MSHIEITISYRARGDKEERRGEETRGDETRTYSDEVESDY